MDNGPGVSLFQCTEILQLNTSTQREEEEEALEDEKRRNEELQNLLTEAFDDSSDNDDEHSTLNSSHCDDSSNGFGDIDKHNYSVKISKNGNTPLQQLNQGIARLVDNTCNLYDEKVFQNKRNKENWKISPSSQETDGLNDKKTLVYQQQYCDNTDQYFKTDSREAYREADYNSVDQLQILYDVRLREIKRLTEKIETEQNGAANYKDQMYRKLALCEAEKERAIISRTEANELLVQSKGEINELQKEVASLKLNVTKLENTKSELSKELSISQTMINELQQKLTMVERCDIQKRMEKEMDSVIEKLKNKHQQELFNLQQQIDKISRNYHEKENECSTLEQKLAEMQRNQEALLVDKSETINQLARTVEESQAQCRQLMAANVSCDNIRLQILLDEAVQEKKELQQALKSIQTECDMLKSDVAQYENLTKLSFPGEDSSSDETDSIINLGISQKNTSRRTSNINIADMGSKLKDELHRAVLNQKAKRMEIYRLNEMLNAKEKQIQEMGKKEKLYLAQTEALKEDMAKIMEQLKAQKKNENVKEVNTELVQKEEIDKLNEKIVELQKEKHKLISENQELEKKYKALEVKLEELNEKLADEKKSFLERYNKQYMEFHEDTLSKLRNEMIESSEKKFNENRMKLEETLKELDNVKKLYIDVSKAKEHLSQELKKEQENKEKEKEDLKSELNKLKTKHDQLMKKVQASKKENDELISKLKRHETELANNDSPQTVMKLRKECDDLQQEISQMSSLHTNELCKVRTELQASRERLMKLEKNLHKQLEAEIVKVQSEKEEMRLQFEEKESNLKRIIEAQKRRPIMRDIGIETDDICDSMKKRFCNCEEKIKEEKINHEKELEFCKEQIDNLIRDHQLELKIAEDKFLKLQESHRQALDAIQKRLIEENECMKIKHISELALVEEKTKDMAVKFFTEEFRKLEIKFQEQLEAANRDPDTTVVEELQKALEEKMEEVTMIKEAFSKSYNEYEKKIDVLNKRIDEDRDKMSELMKRWALEVQSMKTQIAGKDSLIAELKSKLKTLRTTVKAYRNQLTGSRNNLIAAQAKMESILTEKEKEIDIRIEEIERQYETKEKELRKQIDRKLRT